MFTTYCVSSKIDFLAVAKQCKKIFKGPMSKGEGETAYLCPQLLFFTSLH